MWFIRFKQLFFIFLFPWIMSLLIQAFGRAYLLYTYIDKTQIDAYFHDVVQLFIIGLRFDMRISSIAFGALLGIVYLLAFFTKQYTHIQKWLPFLVTLITSIILIFTVVNVFYFMTYNRAIDVFIFGFVDDDTVAILKTIWSNYPVISGIISLVLAIIIIYVLCRLWQRFVLKHVCRPNPLWVAVPVILSVLFCIFVGARGGLGVFPLRESDAQISRYPILNQFVPNGVIAFEWSYKGYKMNNQIREILPADRDNAMIHFFGERRPDTVSIFIQKTPFNPIAAKKPPHVVLSVMESMGSHFFEFDTPDRDLYGSLRLHWQNDWVFTRFVSEGDGTIDTLNRFFMRSPMDKISQSSAQNSHFVSNMFAPFKQKGYKIIYLTAGNGSWRNLSTFLPKLGVDEVVEQNTLRHVFPEAKAGTWGVDDEYMFKYAEKRLAEANKKGEHLLIVMMSVSNHPPYVIPAHAPYQNYTFTPAELDRLQNLGSESEIRNIFNTFRYSNDQLGNFIQWVKTHELSEHTIIAATGDHNLRGIGYTDPKEIALSHSVPFYLYVPQDYRYHTRYDSNRIGSHKDIVPTLYHLALSNTPYYKTGCNLVSARLDNLWCNVGYNPYVTIDKKGAYSLIDNQFFPWKDQTGLALADPMDPISDEAKVTLQRWQSWTTLLQWQINKQIIDSQSRKE